MPTIGVHHLTLGAGVQRGRKYICNRNLCSAKHVKNQWKLRLGNRTRDNDWICWNRLFPGVSGASERTRRYSDQRSSFKSNQYSVYRKQILCSLPVLFHTRRSSSWSRCCCMSLLGREKYLFPGQPGMWKDTCVVQMSWSGRKECIHGVATPLDTMCFLGCGYLCLHLTPLA